MNELALISASNVLQITFAVEEYQHMIAVATKSNVFSLGRLGSTYWEKLPRYLIGRCPLCSTSYTALLDTHNLKAGLWDTHPGGWRSFSVDRCQSQSCAHIIAEEVFVNLNGVIPHEVSNYDNKIDVPFVMPPFVEEDGVAVIHALPICRIERDRFVPRYTAFIIVYYAVNPALFRERRRDANTAYGAGDRDYHPSAMFTWSKARAYPESYDLALWVLRQKLYWLDTTTPNLELRTGTSEDFPYAGIEGHRVPFGIRNGQLFVGV